MKELKNLIFTERFRPQTLSEVILSNDNRKCLENCKKGSNIPSYIFYSSPGTGKTSAARSIINDLGCDSLFLNSSEERGIDVIRDKIKSFVTSLSSTGKQRCIFLDEADQATQIAQDSLRNLMETYSNNCFFILTGNQISKIVPALKSRCVILDFNKPPKKDIEKKLLDIIDKEGIDLGMNVDDFISKYYPDIRLMVKKLQEIKLGLTSPKGDYESILLSIKSEDFSYLKTLVYSGELKVLDFNKWLFQYVFDNWENYGLEKASKIVNLLADTEKSSVVGVSVEVVFLANILEASLLL